MSKLLFPEERPVMLQKSIAFLYSTNEAIFLQQLHYWLLVSSHEREGRKWIYKTRQEWLEQDFPFFSESTLKRVIKHLKDDGIIIVSNFNKMKQDRTSWYTIDYEVLGRMVAPVSRTDQVSGVNRNAASGQNDGIDEVHLTQALTREYTENTQRVSSTPSDDGEAFESDFEYLWKLYPRRERRKAAYQAYKRAVKNGVTNQQIEEGIVAYNKHIQQLQIEPRFVKQGGTWFYQECWNDDYDVILETYEVVPQTTTKTTASFDERMQQIYGDNWKGLLHE